MDDNEKKFSLTFGLQKDDENGAGAVFYKQDGHRFGSNCTIKMTVETVYKFTLTFRPPQVIDSVSVKGSSVNVTQKEMSEISSTYNFDWFSSGVCKTKHNVRDCFPIVLTVRHLGDLTVYLQIKFYKANDKNHSVWGTALHHIDFDCVYKNNHSFVEVTKEVYR